MDTKLLDLNEVAKAVTDIATSQMNKQGVWIPCSERLPEEDGIYAILVSGADGDLCLFVRRFVSGIWSSILRQQDVKAWFEVPISEPTWWNEKDMVNV